MAKKSRTLKYEMSRPRAVTAVFGKQAELLKWGPHSLGIVYPTDQNTWGAIVLAHMPEGELGGMPVHVLSTDKNDALDTLKNFENLVSK